MDGAIATSKVLLFDKIMLTNLRGIILDLVESVLNHILKESLSAIAFPVTSNEVLSSC